MKTLKDIISYDITIKNSRFICYLYPILDCDIQGYLDFVKKEHPKATHYCYAYIYDDVKHSSDDGEPGGTAGLPILNVLEKEQLNHTLAIVVRYFGGIKLGVGGLVRAYTKSVTETLKQASFQDLISGYKIKLLFSYENENDVLYILNQSEIIQKEYLENVSYICYVDLLTFESLSKYHPIIIEKCIIKKLS